MADFSRLRNKFVAYLLPQPSTGYRPELDIGQTYSLPPHFSTHTCQTASSLSGRKSCRQGILIPWNPTGTDTEHSWRILIDRSTSCQGLLSLRQPANSCPPSTVYAYTHHFNLKHTCANIMHILVPQPAPSRLCTTTAPQLFGAKPGTRQAR